MRLRALAAAAAVIGLSLGLGTARASAPRDPQPASEAAPASGEAPAQALIASATLSIAATADGDFTGTGWDRLIGDARAAQFVLMGEQHGSGSIALLETAVTRALQPSGFNHLALEIGPNSARFAERTIRSGPGKLGQYIGMPGHGLTIPFLFFADETKMAEDLVATSTDRREALWGLDQEFSDSGPVLLAQLTSYARSPAQRAAVGAFGRAVAADAKAVGNGDAAMLDRLDRAFPVNSEGGRVIAALRTTAKIYAPYMAGRGDFYTANLARENYMKTNFATAFEQTERRTGQPPKVLLKFGGNHMMRGINLTYVPSLGTFVTEWGRPRGFRAVNMLIDCIGGEVLNPMSGTPVPCDRVMSTDSFLGQITRDQAVWQAIDLSVLRSRLRLLGDIDAESRQMILGFDYYIAVRGGRAARPFGNVGSAEKTGN